MRKSLRNKGLELEERKILWAERKLHLEERKFEYEIEEEKIGSELSHAAIRN